MKQQLRSSAAACVTLGIYSGGVGLGMHFGRVGAPREKDTQRTDKNGRRHAAPTQFGLAECFPAACNAMLQYEASRAGSDLSMDMPAVDLAANHSFAFHSLV